MDIDSGEFHILDLIKRSQTEQIDLLREDSGTNLMKTVALTADLIDFKNKTKWVNVIPPLWDSDQQDGYVQNIVDDFFLAATKNLTDSMQENTIYGDELKESNNIEKNSKVNGDCEIINSEQQCNKFDVRYGISSVVTKSPGVQELTTVKTATSSQQMQKKKTILNPSNIDFKNKSSRKKDGNILTPIRKLQPRMCSERYSYTTSPTTTILELSQQSIKNKVPQKNKSKKQFNLRPIDFTEMHPEWKLDVAIDNNFMLNNTYGALYGGRATLFPRRIPNPNHVQKTVNTDLENACRLNIPELSMNQDISTANDVDENTQEKLKWVRFGKIAEKVFGNDVKHMPSRGVRDRKWGDIFQKDKKKLKILRYSPINLNSYCDDGNNNKRIIIEHKENKKKICPERQFNIHHLPILSIRGDCRIKKLHNIIIAPSNVAQAHQSDAQQSVIVGISHQEKSLPNENVKYFQFIYKNQREEERLKIKLKEDFTNTITTSITNDNQIYDEKKTFDNQIFNKDNNLKNSLENKKYEKTFEEFINQFGDEVQTENAIKTSATNRTNGDIAGYLMPTLNSNERIRTMAKITNKEYRDLVAELMANVECSDEDEDRAGNVMVDGLQCVGGNKYLEPFNLIIGSEGNKIINVSDDNQFEYCDDTFENPNSLTYLTNSSKNKITNDSPSVVSSILDFDLSGSVKAKSDISLSLTDDEKLSSRFIALNSSLHEITLKEENANKKQSDRVINIYDHFKEENQFNDDENKLKQRKTSKSYISENDTILQMLAKGQLRHQYQNQHQHQHQHRNHKQQQLKAENINLLENDKAIKEANGNNNNNNNNNVTVFQPNNNKKYVSVDETFNNRFNMYGDEWEAIVKDKQNKKKQQHAFKDFIAATTATAVTENGRRVIIQNNSHQEENKQNRQLNGGNSRTVNLVYKNLYENSNNETVGTDGKVCNVDGLINSVSISEHCNTKSVLNDNDGNISCRNLLDVTELRNTLHSVGMKLIDLQQRRSKGDVTKKLDKIYDDIKSQNDENMAETHILQHNNGAAIMGINVVSCNKGNWQSQHVPSVSMVSGETNEVDKRQFINMIANHHLTKTNSYTESTKCENYITVKEGNVDYCGGKGACFDKSIPQNYRFKHTDITPTPTSNPLLDLPQYVAVDNIIKQPQQHQHQLQPLQILSQQQCIVDNSNTITSLKNKTDRINNNKLDALNPNQCQKLFFSPSCDFNDIKNCYSSLHPSSSSSQMVVCCLNPKCANKNNNYLHQQLNSCNCIEHSQSIYKCNCFRCCKTDGLTSIERVTAETQTIQSTPPKVLPIKSSDYKQIENPFINYQRPLLPRRQIEKPVRYNHKEFQRLVLESSPKMGKTIKSIIQNSGNDYIQNNKLLNDGMVNTDKSQKAVKRFLNSIKQKINRTNRRYKESDLLSSDFSSIDDELLRNSSSSNYSSDDKDLSISINKTRKLVTAKENVARNIILREMQTNSDNRTKDTSDSIQTMNDTNRIIKCDYSGLKTTQRLLPRYPLEWPYIEDTASDVRNNSIYSTSSIEFQIAKLKLVSGNVDDNNEFEVTPHISPVTSSCASLPSSNEYNNICPKTVREIIANNNSLSDGEILSQGEIRSNGSGF